MKARSASDSTDDWPLWFIADERGINIMTEGRYYGGKLDTRERCEAMAAEMSSKPLSLSR